MPTIHLSHYSTQQKKPRFPQHPDFSFDGQISLPAFPSNFLGPSNPFGCLAESTPAGIQGARHANYGISLSNLHFNKLQSGLFQAGFPPLDHTASPVLRVSSNNAATMQKVGTGDNVSCLLSMSTATQPSKKVDDVKAPQLVLFGQTILTEQQISLNTSAKTDPTRNNSFDGNADKMCKFSDGFGYALHPQGSSLERLQW